VTCEKCGRPIDLLPFDEKGHGSGYLTRQVDGKTVAFHLGAACSQPPATTTTNKATGNRQHPRGI
jgi:hypothetical protein